MTKTLTLTEFLAARIEEDEAAGRRLHAEDCGTPAEVVPDGMGRPMSPTCGCDWPITRVLAECEAKRLVVDRYAQSLSDAVHDDWDAGKQAAYGRVAHILATAYAEHPDYDPAWRL